MISLDLNAINSLSSYTVWKQNERYYFRTDFDIVYTISFDEEAAFVEDKAYWFNLSNTSNKKSPRDHKIRETIFVLLKEFFDKNPDILLYICDTSNDQQAQRDRLFLSWFNIYGNKRFSILTALVADETEENYIAMILLKEHPHYDAIVKRFNEEIAMFKENK